MNYIEEESLFLNAIDKAPMSSLYTLCNILFCSKNPDEPERVARLLSRINDCQLNTLIVSLLDIEKERKRFLDVDRLHSFQQFKICLLSHASLFYRVSENHIFEFSLNEELTIYAVLAIIRQHWRERDNKDIFSSFDFRLFKQASFEQLQSSLSQYLHSLELPIEGLRKLGVISAKHASIVMGVFQNHQRRFFLDSIFLSKFSELEEEIYNKWIVSLDDPLLNDIQAHELKQLSEELSTNYPLFKNIKKHKRFIYKYSDQDFPYDYSFNIASGITSFLTLAKFTPQYLCAGSRFITCLTTASSCGLSQTLSPLFGPTATIMLTAFMAYKATPRYTKQNPETESEKNFNSSFSTQPRIA